MKSCLFAGPGELPHAGSRAVVFGRWPDRRAPAKWQRLCTAFVSAAQLHPSLARVCTAAAGVNRLCRGRIRLVAGALRRIAKWLKRQSEWRLQQRFRGPDAADETGLFSETSDPCRPVVKNRERRSERLLTGAVFRRMGQRIRRAPRWQIPGQVDTWTRGYAGD